ncbi:UbiD decarboxylyase family [Cadophora sp. MPI-SDFR-AT-0126]|nr:UbiD decarboxylyase family [Leotiomycetes sp. MPI-SDFR-AT-0126]
MTAQSSMSTPVSETLVSDSYGLTNIDPHMNFRSYVEALRKDGDLVDVNVEVDPDLELAAITRRALETSDRAPLFNNIKGAHHGLFRILGAPASLRRSKAEQFGRLARHLGLPPTATMPDIFDHILAAKMKKLIPPVVVKDGPCKENKLFGDQIDLTRLPAPLMHRFDGGKYIQTFGMHIVQTPDKKWTNWSISRSMVHDKDHLTCLILPPQHLGRIYAQWEERKEDIPWALAMGVPPAAILVAGMPIPEGVSEGEFIGAMTGSALEVVKCETNDLMVPANAEIVFEGTMSITEKGDEGPFGEIHGYTFIEPPRQMPLCHVEAITHRNEAVFPVCVPGRPVDETHTVAGAFNGAVIRERLQAAGLPVKEVFTPFETQTLWAVVQIDCGKLRAMRTNPKQLCEKIGNTIFTDRSGMFEHHILVVSDDIDIFDFKDVMWAYTTRCRPGVDDFYFHNTLGFSLTPYQSQGEGPPDVATKIVSNCLLPVEYTTGPNWESGDFEHGFPDDLKQKVLNNWSKYGF